MTDVTDVPTVPRYSFIKRDGSVPHVKPEHRERMAVIKAGLWDDTTLTLRDGRTVHAEQVGWESLHTVVAMGTEVSTGIRVAWRLDPCDVIVTVHHA